MPGSSVAKWLLVFGAAIGCGVSATRAATVDELAWLKGCWRSAGEGRQTEEHWLAPAGGTMLGISQTTAAGTTVEFEFMRIAQENNGDIFFIAMPSGQKEARFRLVKSGAREAVFENPMHDFPQRVIYRLEGDDSLLGRIEGISKGKEKAVDFPLKRISCDG